MAQRVRRGRTSEYTQAPEPSLEAPVARPPTARRGSHELFPALCAKRPRGPPQAARTPLVYSPPPGDVARALTRSSSTLPGRSCLALPAQPDAVSAWRTIRAELAATRRRFRLSRSGWPRSSVACCDGDVAHPARPARRRRSGSPAATGRVLERCVRASSAPAPRVVIRRRSAPSGPRASRLGAAPHGPLRAPSRAQPALHASSSSSSVRATAWPTPPPWPWPSSPARPTTRSSSTPRPGWARRTCCTRSATTSWTSAAAPTVRYTTAEAFTNHFIAALERADARRLQARLPRRRRAADRRHPVPGQQGQAPRRSSSTPSTRCTRPAASSCSPATACRGHWSRIEQRLRERFEAGLVADISPPDLATRVTILRKRAALDGVAAGRPERARADRRPRRPTTSARWRAR